MSDVRELDATELARRIASGETSAAEALRSALAAIDTQDGALHAFLRVDREAALERARALDAAQRRGEPLGALHGVPVALKSNMCIADRETNCASRILAGYRPPYTATFVQRLLDAGAIPLGHTNMDEFAMGSSSENSAFGPTRNPWDLARTPGGSSSGSAVAVASGMCPLALGSDTGGSVRQPAALCGVAGFKPTYGRVSRYGLIAFGSSLDQVSPFARSVRDLELATSVISGADPRDSTCVDAPPLAPEEPREGLAGLRVGIPAEALGAGLERGVRRAFDAACAELAALGADCVPVSLAHLEAAIPTYYVVATAEASSNLARYEGVRYGARVPGDGTLQGMFAATRAAGFGAEVKRRILLGTYVLSAGYYEAWYGRALKVRRLIADDFETAFESVDLIATPTSPCVAFALGERVDDPLAMYQSDVLTVPASLAGLPAVSVPCGFAAQGSQSNDGNDGGNGGLPVGLQLVGPTLADARVLAVARAFEEAGGHRRLPPVRARSEGAVT